MLILHTLVSLFFPAKFPTFAHFWMEVALSKKPDKQMREEAESWASQTQGLIILGIGWDCYGFMWMSTPFECFQIHSPRASFLMPYHVSHISAHICPLGTCKQKRKCGETEWVLRGWQLWTLLRTSSVDCAGQPLCPHQRGSREPGLCLQPLQCHDLGFVHSPWSVTLDKRTGIPLSSVCLLTGWERASLWSHVRETCFKCQQAIRTLTNSSKETPPRTWFMQLFIHINIDSRRSCTNWI